MINSPKERRRVFSFSAESPPSSPLQIRKAIRTQSDLSLQRRPNAHLIDSTFSRPSPRHSKVKLTEVDMTDESPLGVEHIVELDLFSKTRKGQTVFHILAHEDHSQLLLLMLKVAEFLQSRLDLSFFFHRSKLYGTLPIDKAIGFKSKKCAQLILRFMSITGCLPQLLQDILILKIATFTDQLDIVKLLIEHGFHKGLIGDKAISLISMLTNYPEMLRLILYCQTQTVNALEFSRVSSSINHIRILNKGGINWKGLKLEYIDPIWLEDCLSAIDSVSKTLGLMCVSLSVENNYVFFEELGKLCIEYFDGKITSSVIKRTSRHFIPVTKVYISENNLKKVPVELFQLPSLSEIYLSHNQLESLPSSDDPCEMLYTAPISKLMLDWNHLHSLPEVLFRDLAKSLTELNVEYNVLEDLPPGLWVTPALKIVKLAHNHLSRLHYLSSPKYFTNADISKKVVNSFTVLSGALVCDNPMNDQSLTEIKQYLTRLVDFQHTMNIVHPSSQPNATSFEEIMKDIISLHLSRVGHVTSQPKDSEGEAGHRRSRSLLAEVIFPTFLQTENKSVLFASGNFELIDLSHNSFCEVPWELPCIAPELKKLYLNSNSIQELNIINNMPHSVWSMYLNNNQIESVEKACQMPLPCGHPVMLLAIVPKTYDGIQYCRHINHKTLDNLSLLSLNCNKLKEFPTIRVSSITSSSKMDTDLDDDCLPLYPNLSVLSLESNQLVRFPNHLYCLTKLNSIVLSHNAFNELPLEAGLINQRNLYILELEGMNVRNIPSHLLNKPTPKLLLNHLKSMLHE